MKNSAVIFLGVRAPQFLSLPHCYQSFTPPCTVETQCTDQNSGISPDWIPVWSHKWLQKVKQISSDLKVSPWGHSPMWRNKGKCMHFSLTSWLVSPDFSYFLLERFECSRMPLEVFRVPALNFSWIFWDIWRDHHARETVLSHEWKSEVTYQSLKRSGYTTALYGCGVSPFSWGTHATPWTPGMTPAVGQ